MSRYKPKGLVLCSGCSKMVEAVCYGQCPACFKKSEEAIVRDLKSEEDEKFRLYSQIEGLHAEIVKWERKLRRLVVAKGNKKTLCKQLQKLIDQMGAAE